MIGGVVEFLFFVSTIVYSFICALSVRKKNKLWGMLCISSLLTYLIYAYIESVILFDTPVIAITATIFVVTMPIIINHKLEYSYELKNKTGENDV